MTERLTGKYLAKDYIYQQNFNRILIEYFAEKKQIRHNQLEKGVQHF